MAEAAGLVLGALGIAGLFKSCVDNFDIVVRARDFGEEFDLLCTEVGSSTQTSRGLISPCTAISSTDPACSVG